MSEALVKPRGCEMRILGTRHSLLDEMAKTKDTAKFEAVENK